jgi:NIPSNAP
MNATDPTRTNLVELRQYLLHPGQRDTMIQLFDREFVESQEAVGMAVLGQFRDPERPEYFVWLRGFSDMRARYESLAAFYDGPVWAEHRDAANATMIDSDNVMLLRAVTHGDALPSLRPTLRNIRKPTGHIVILVEQVDQIDPATITHFRQRSIRLLEQEQCRTLGVYATESAPNTFTRLPVRTDRALVWIGATQDSDSVTVRQALAPIVGPHQQLLALVPTSRSVLEGSAREPERN